MVKINEKTNGVSWVLLNPALKKTVITLAMMAYSGVALNDELVKDKTVEITQRGALCNAPAMLHAVSVMADTLTRHLTTCNVDLSQTDLKADYNFRPDKHCIIVNDSICLGICNRVNVHNVHQLASENPDYGEYIMLNLDNETLYGMRKGAGPNVG